MKNSGKSEEVAFSGGAQSRLPPLASREIALLWPISFPTGIEASQIEHALRERVKELNCLYGLSQLAERNMYSLEGLLGELVNFLPYSWQYPEIACARLIFKDRTYVSDNFKITNWRQSARIYMYHEAVGECTVFYLQECPPADEGPFLKEERALLDAVAEQIGIIATRIAADLELQETNRQLVLERKALQESNTALKIVLARIEQEKQEMCRDIKVNVEKILMPVLQALGAQLSDSQKKYIEIVNAGLSEIASPFVNQLSSTYSVLTPTEIAICDMIRNGMRSKEIAQIRGISQVTVHRHREKIRRKLKLTNQNVNLATYLESSMWKDSPPGEARR